LLTFGRACKRFRRVDVEEDGVGRAIDLGDFAGACRDDVASAEQDGDEARKRALRARRAATWAEYYSDVMRRAKRHGGVVIWIQPPQVKEVEITAQR